MIENNVIEKGPGAQNPNFVAFGEENNLYADSTLTVTGNTVLNDYGAGADIRLERHHASRPASPTTRPTD